MGFVVKFEYWMCCMSCTAAACPDSDCTSTLYADDVLIDGVHIGEAMMGVRGSKARVDCEAPRVTLATRFGGGAMHVMSLPPFMARA
jgi:hypothetical protein